MLKLFTTPRRENDPSPPAPPEPGDVPGGMPGGVLPGWLGVAASVVLKGGADRRRFKRSEAQAPASGMRDYVFAEDLDEAQPRAAFDRLRWGGQFVFVSDRPAAVGEAVRRFGDRPEWRADGGVQTVAVLRWPRLDRLRRGWFERRLHVAVFRKVLIDPVDRLSAKHSYHVRLIPFEGEGSSGGWAVLKRVPTMEEAIARLTQTCPGVPADRLTKIAAKLVKKVFPVFLTREAAFLKLLQRDLPPAMRGLTPAVLDMKTQANGLVDSVTLRWLRQGGEPISQGEFARQSAALLRAVHERAGMMHLDLRLDNMVVTEAGVGIVDFGSAVRVGEDLSANAMIDTLAREMLMASQVTRDLQRQRDKGLVNAPIFRGLPYPPTPAFDLFALVTNLTRPHDNPEFKGLVEHDRRGAEAQRMSRLRRRVLSPAADEPRRIETLGGLCDELGVDPLSPPPGQRDTRRPDLEPRREAIHLAPGQ